ncbi:MAG: hypothetical protein J6P54_06180, partial [Bacteroidales bacterium]|nr:hypothetical protein [Bacteroidales bacterium]
MKNLQNRKRKFIQWLLLLMAVMWAGGTRALAQSAQAIYNVGDIFEFPDHSKGVVCYVNPDNPQEGWVVDLKDLPVSNQSTNAGKFAIYDGTTLPFSKQEVNTFEYGLDSWTPEGKRNTDLLFANREKSPLMQNQVMENRYYAGWYIPDIQQLCQIFALMPFIETSLSGAGGTVIKTNSNDSERYWSSSASDSKKVYFMYFSTGNNTGGGLSSTTQLKVRLVREFKVGQAYAYWQEPLDATGDTVQSWTFQSPSANNHWRPEADTTFHAVVVYGDTAFTGIEETVHMHPVYKYQNGDPRTPLKDTVCQVIGGTYRRYGFNIDISEATAPGQTKFQEISPGTRYGCDSIVRMYLTVNPIYSLYDTAIVCEGEPYVWERNGRTYTGAQDVHEIFETKDGCDSIWHLHLVEVPKPNVVITPDDPWICAGNTLNLSASTATCGDVRYPLLYDNFQKASSIPRDNLVVGFHQYTDLFDTGDYVYSTGAAAVKLGKWDNPNALWGTLTTKPLELPDNQECTLVLSMKGWGKPDNAIETPPTRVKISLNGDPIDTITLLGYYNSNSSANVYHTYSLNFNSGTTHPVIKIESFDDVAWKTANTADGILEERFYIDSFAIFDNTPCSFVWTFPDGSHPEGATQTIVNIGELDAGAYSVVATNTTMLPHTIYGDAEPSANGQPCRSSAEVTVTLGHPTDSTMVVNTCGSYTWHGVTYDATPNPYPTFDTINVAGCDSTVTLRLTINNAIVESHNDFACDRYVWMDGDDVIYTFTSSNSYTHTFTSVSGCDSVVTLNMTIWHPNTGDTTAVACNEFTWHGVTYNETPSPAPTHTYTNANGCDSVVTLHLTILKPSVAVTASDVTVCNGSPIELTASTTGTPVGDVTYSWSGPNFGPTTASANPNVTVVGQATSAYNGRQYTVTATATQTLSDRTCTATSEATVTVTVNTPSVTLADIPSQTICTGEQATLAASV